jgi:hypothetical protein
MGPIHLTDSAMMWCSFVAVIVVSGNVSLPLWPHLATHLVMVPLLGQWNGWYCGHILTLPEVATQLASLARGISPTLEYLTLLPLGVAGLGLTPFLGAPPAGIASYGNPRGHAGGNGAPESGYPLPCGPHLSLWQLWASVGGTLTLLLTDWTARRRFLARALAAPGGAEVDPYKIVVCQLRVGAESLIRLLIALAMGYSMFWAVALMAGGPPIPFWLRNSVVTP